MRKDPVTCRVDLTDPEVLDRVVKEHLRFAACPVDGLPFPGLLKDVTVVLALPDGSERTCDAQVVLQLGPDRFIVQLMHKLDVPQLAFLARMAQRAGRRGAGEGTRPPAAASDAPFEGTPVARRRERHLPKPDPAPMLQAREALFERAAQPPPRVSGSPRLKRT